MGKIEKLLDKTKRNGETKKWKVYLSILIILIAGGLLFSGAYVITEPIIDSWLSTTHPINQIFDFYEEEMNAEEQSVYFVGSSLVATAVYAPLIKDNLDKLGYNLSVYNLFVPSDTLLMRSIQVEKMVKSSPKLIILGISYESFVAESWNKEYMVLATGRYNLTTDLSSLYTDNELSDLNPGIFYKRGYLVRSFLPSSFVDRPANAIVEPYGEIKRKAYDTTKDINSMVAAANNPKNLWRPEITLSETREIQALKYFLNSCNEASIPVLVINMPIHPLLSEKITDESRDNYFTILSSLGVNIIDMEKEYGDDHFWDLMHTTWNGSQEFSMKMTDIIIQEMT